MSKSMSPKRVLASVKRSLSKPKVVEEVPDKKTASADETTSMELEGLPRTSSNDSDKEDTDDQIFQVDDDDDEDAGDILNRSFVRQLLDTPSSSKLMDDSGNKNSKKEDNGLKSVSFTGVDTGSVASDMSLHEKTVEQLIEKIEKLTIDKKQAEIDLSAEKTIRKKKERNLVKLAKELNKRAAESKAATEKADKVREEVASLQIRLETTKKELEVHVEANQKSSREYHSEIAAMQEKYKNLTSNHDQFTQGLRKEILEANLTADKLRTKLARLEMEHAPNEMDDIAERTMLSMEKSVAPPALEKKKNTHFDVLVALAIVASVVVMAIFNLDMTSVDAFCGPAMPGTVLIDDIHLEAPWWAPTALKPSTFGLICGERTRSRIEWDASKLTMRRLDGKDPAVLWEKKLEDATIFPKHIEFRDKRGKVDKFKFPWSS